MSTEPESLILEHLRAIRADLTALSRDVREIRTKQNDLILQMAALRRDQAADAQIAASMEVRIDRLGDRVERIERRLDLTNNLPTV